MSGAYTKELNTENPMKIKVGDIITAYHKGYHKVTGLVNDTYRIGNKDFNVELVEYEKVGTESGKKSAKTTNRCNIEFCSKVTPDSIEEEYQEAILVAKVKKEFLLQILNMGN